MDNQLDMSSIYGIPPCTGGDCTPGNLYMPESSRPAGSMVPSLEQIAGYNYQNSMREAPGMTNSMMGTEPARQPAPQMQMNQGAAPMAPKPSAAPNMPMPITPNRQPEPLSGESLQYLNGFLRTQLGRTVQVEFLVGANTIIDKVGVLLAVGANYILINETQSDDITACDFYNIKFIRFYY